MLKILIYIFLENRAKTRFDQIQSMSEAKHALKTLFELVGEKKSSNTSQLYELQSEVTEVILLIYILKDQNE